MKIRLLHLRSGNPAGALAGLCIIAVLCLGAPSAAVSAQEVAQTAPFTTPDTSAPDPWQRDVFAFSIGPIPVGAVSVTSRDDGVTYEVRMTLHTTGFAGLVRPISFDGETSGIIVSGKGGSPLFQPLAHRQSSNTGRHASRTVIDFSGGRPQVTNATVLTTANGVAEREHTDADDAARGSIDPLTLVLSVLRTGTDTQICGTTALVFDGLRVTRADIGPPDHSAERTRCTGTYGRVAGFSTAEMAERQSFAFVLTFGFGMDGRPRLDLVEMDTLYGKGRLKRR